MLTPPMLGDFRSTLLKRADVAEQKHATLWQQMVGHLSGRLGAYLKADLRRSLAALLDVAGPDVWRAYVDVYGGLAREFGVTLIAPSAYLPDPVDGVVRNLPRFSTSKAGSWARRPRWCCIRRTLTWRSPAARGT